MMDDGIEEIKVFSSFTTGCKETEVTGAGKLMKAVHYEGDGHETEGKCSRLDLSCKDNDKNDIKLSKFNCLDFSSYSLDSFRNLHVLLLRNNRLPDLAHMNLSEMRCLIHLDIACNQLSGEISNGAFPPSLETLDISENFLDCLSGLIWCPNLVALNISNNRIKAISALPPKLIELNISNNRLTGITNLRHLSLSPLISSLRIQGNPVVEPAGLFRATVKSILTKLEQLDGEYLPGYKLRNHKITPEEQVVCQKKKSLQQQKESDQLRHEEYSRRLEERKLRRNAKYSQIDNNSSSRSPVTPTKADQVQSDRQRMHFNCNRESILELERANIVEHLTAQYKRKPTLTKESTKNIIAKMRNASPYNVTVKTPPSITQIPASGIRSSPGVRTAPTSGGYALPIQSPSEQVKRRNITMSSGNKLRTRDHSNGNDSNSANHNNANRHDDTNDYDHDDYDNKNDVSDITHNNTVYSKSDKLTRLYPPHELADPRCSSGELIHYAEASSRRKSRLKMEKNIENPGSIEKSNDRNENDSQCDYETYSHIYDNRNQKEYSHSYTDQHTKKCINESTIKIVKHGSAMSAELENLPRNIQKDFCMKESNIEPNEIDAGPDPDPDADLDADVIYERYTEGNLRTVPGSSSIIYADSDVTKNSSKATTMGFQTLDGSMPLNACKNKNEIENGNENGTGTVGMNTIRKKDIHHIEMKNRENMHDPRERGSEEEKGKGKGKRKEEYAIRNCDINDMENNKINSRYTKKEVEVTLGDVVALACEVAIVQNKEGLQKVKQEITSSSEKSKRDESNDIEVDLIKEKNRNQLITAELEAAEMSDGETGKLMDNKKIKIVERTVEVKLSNGGTTILDINQMKEIDNAILEKKESMSTSFYSSGGAGTSHDDDNLTPQLHLQMDISEGNINHTKDICEQNGNDSGIKLSRNQKKKANRKKKYDLISEEKVKHALTMKGDSENDERSATIIQSGEKVDRTGGGEMKLFSSMDIGGIQSLYPTLDSDTVFVTESPTHSLKSNIVKKSHGSSTRVMGTLNEGERLIDLMDSSPFDNKTEVLLSSAEKRRIRGGIFTFADARALLRDEERKGNVKGRGVSGDIAKAEKEEDDKDRQRVAHRLNYRENYANQIIENDSSQEIREKKQREKEVKAVRETRRRRGEIDTHLQESSQLDDRRTPYEGNGFKILKNSNGTIKEEKEKIGEREREREGKIEEGSLTSAPVFRPAVYVSYSVCSSIDATDTGSGLGSGLGFRGDRHNILDNSFIDARYRQNSNKLVNNSDFNAFSNGDSSHSNAQYSGSRTDSILGQRHENHIDPRSGLTSVSQSPQAQQQPSSPSRLPPPSVFFSLYNSTTSSFRAKCSNVVDPFKLYKSSQVEKSKAEKRKIKISEGNKTARNSSNFIDNSHVLIEEVPSDTRADKTERVRRNLEIGGEKDTSAHCSRPIIPSSDKQFNSENKNTVNRVGHREVRTQQEIEYEAERQREIESCFNWVKRASELLQHLPPSSSNSVTGDRRGQGQEQGHDLNLNLSPENIRKITTATESIKKQTAMKNDKNLYIDCDDSTYENLNRSSDTNCYDRTNRIHGTGHNHKYDSNGNNNSTGSRLDSYSSINKESIYNKVDVLNVKPIDVVDNVETVLGNRDHDPTKSSQLESIVTYFKSHLSQRSRRVNEMKVNENHSSYVDIPKQSSALNIPPRTLTQVIQSLPHSSPPSSNLENKKERYHDDPAEIDEHIYSKKSELEYTFQSETIKRSVLLADREDPKQDSAHDRRYETDIGLHAQQIMFEENLNNFGDMGAQYDLNDEEILSLLSSYHDLPASVLEDALGTVMTDQVAEPLGLSPGSGAVSALRSQIPSINENPDHHESKVVQPTRKNQKNKEINSTLQNIYLEGDNSDLKMLEFIGSRSSFNLEGENIPEEEEEEEEEKEKSGLDRSCGERGSESPIRNGGMESPKRIIEAPSATDPHIKKSDILEMEGSVSPKQNGDRVKAVSADSSLPCHSYLRSTNSFIPQKKNRSRGANLAVTSSRDLGHNASRGVIETEWYRDGDGDRVKFDASRGTRDLRQPPWNGNISPKRRFKESNIPTLKRICTKIPGKKDSFSLRPDVGVNGQHSYLSVPTSISLRQSSIGNSLIDSTSDDENDFKYSDNVDYDDIIINSNEVAISNKIIKIDDNKNEIKNLRQNTLQLKLKKKINELDLKVQSWQDNSKDKCEYENEYDCQADSRGGSTCSSVRTACSGSVLSCFGPLKIKNGEVVSNDFGNNQDDEGKRKSGSAERQLTAKEKLRIMLSEADRKDQITLRIAQEIE